MGSYYIRMGSMSKKGVLTKYIITREFVRNFAKHKVTKYFVMNKDTVIGEWTPIWQDVLTKGTHKL